MYVCGLSWMRTGRDEADGGASRLVQPLCRAHGERAPGWSRGDACARGVGTTRAGLGGAAMATLGRGSGHRGHRRRAASGGTTELLMFVVEDRRTDSRRVVAARTSCRRTRRRGGSRRCAAAALQHSEASGASTARGETARGGSSRRRPGGRSCGRSRGVTEGAGARSCCRWPTEAQQPLPADDGEGSGGAGGRPGGARERARPSRGGASLRPTGGGWRRG